MLMGLLSHARLAVLGFSRGSLVGQGKWATLGYATAFMQIGF
jgi:hypothetical protein